MSDKESKLNPKLLFRAVSARIERFKPYSFVGFVVFVAIIYGYVLLRIDSLSKTEPAASAVTSQVKTSKIPKIDESVVRQLESLQDNSVSVQALFNEARSNPFQ